MDGSFRFLATILLAAVSAPVGAQERIGAFIYSPDIDPMTDQDRSVIGTPEIEGTALRTAYLSWGCNGSELVLFVAADEYLNDDGPVAVQWRVDRQDPVPTRMWPVTSSGRTVIAPSADIGRLTDQALPGNEVVVRVTNFRRASYDLRFSLTGLTRAFNQLACSGDLQRHRVAAGGGRS